MFGCCLSGMLGLISKVVCLYPVLLCFVALMYVRCVAGQLLRESQQKLHQVSAPSVKVQGRK